MKWIHWKLSGTKTEQKKRDVEKQELVLQEKVKWKKKVPWWQKLHKPQG